MPVGIFDELLVDPAPSIVPAPHLAPQKSAGDRSPRDHDRPKMPDIGPGSTSMPGEALKEIVAVHIHFRPRRWQQGRQAEYYHLTALRGVEPDG